MSAFSPCAGPTHFSEPSVEHTCLCYPRAVRCRRAKAPAHGGGRVEPDAPDIERINLHGTEKCHFTIGVLDADQQARQYQLCRAVSSKRILAVRILDCAPKEKQLALGYPRRGRQRYPSCAEPDFATRRHLAGAATRLRNGRCGASRPSWRAIRPATPPNALTIPTLIRSNNSSTNRLQEHGALFICSRSRTSLALPFPQCSRRRLG